MSYAALYEKHMEGRVSLGVGCPEGTALREAEMQRLRGQVSYLQGERTRLLSWCVAAEKELKKYRPFNQVVVELKTYLDSHQCIDEYMDTKELKRNGLG